MILYNKNCVSNCDDYGLFELDRKTCVNKCPDYTFERIVNGSKTCFNCKDDGDKCIYLGKIHEKGTECIACDNYLYTFKSNYEFNILDDCYEDCEDCSEGGTVEKMNCDTCKSEKPCLVEESGNCVKENSIVDYHYPTKEGM